MKKNKKHYDKYKKFDVVYADFGRNPHGVQGGIRPGIVVSCDASNHGGAPQISVVPLSSKLKDNPVHVIVEPSEIRGYALSNRSDFMPEDIQTLNKGCVRFKSGYIPGESKIREAMDRAMIMHFQTILRQRLSYAVSRKRAALFRSDKRQQRSRQCVHLRRWASDRKNWKN